MAKKESNIFNRIMMAVSQGGTRLFRNHTGMVKDSNGRVHRFGLCPGSSDGIGWHTITITPEMVGKRVAVFMAIEAKTPKGKVSEKQANFIDQVQKAGGIAGVARSEDDAMALIYEYEKVINHGS